MENRKTLFVLLACALFAGVLGETTTPVVPTPETTPASTSTSTTTSAPTPAPETTTPPPAPTTTTPAPATTTTPAPVTTVAPPTPAPTPVPSDGRGNWTVKGDNVTCIIAQMILSAKVDYPLVTVNQTGKVKVTVPPTAKAEGACDATSQWIKLSWDDNSVQVDFKKNETSKMYYISNITLAVFASPKLFPNISSELANKSLEFMRVKEDFMVNLNQSFRCSREQDLPLFNNGSKAQANLALSSVQLQAFHTGDAVVFGAAQDCELDTPDIVPIAVGCALAALVCVVLVAYLVGRRRSQARGYLSIFLD